MTQFLTLTSGVGPVKKAALAPIIAISWLSLIAPPLSTAAVAAPSASTCPASGISASSGAINLTSNCQVNGNVTLSGTASLTMNSAMLAIQGNLVLSGQAQLTVMNGGLTFPQTNYSQYSVTLNNSSRLHLYKSTFTTNGTPANNFSMALYAYNNSVVYFVSSTLSTTGGSWLLGNFHDQSQLIVGSSQNLPTEIYPSDSSKILVINSSFSGLWLDFLPGSSGTVNVPQHNSQGNFSFVFGNSHGFNYSVQMGSSMSRLGLNSYPNSSMTVNGHGTAGTNDVGLVFGYFIQNNTAPVSINGLNVGGNVTRQFTDQGRNLSLNNVNLNPFSWQVYVSQSNGFPVTVSNSKINEIAALTNGLLNISNCVLQLAVTGAVGPGSQMNITGTQIWSQSVLAQNGGQVSITYSQIHGNYVSASSPGSSISMANVADLRNASSSITCTSATGYPPNTNGVPLCNPFNPLGQCSQMSTQNGGVITGTPTCIPAT